MSNKTGTPSPNALYGWFVDNIMVEGALRIGAYILTVDNQQAKPEGARYMPTQNVRVEGKDNVGVDSIHLRVATTTVSAWTTWNDSLMTYSKYELS